MHPKRNERGKVSWVFRVESGTDISSGVLHSQIRSTGSSFASQKHVMRQTHAEHSNPEELLFNVVVAVAHDEDKSDGQATLGNKIATSYPMGFKN